jgi:DNA-binding NarL/FixJ family response regulator
VITVFLVEDEQLVRAGLRMWLELAPDMCVVGEAATGEQAIQVIPAAQPNVAVIDMMLPGMDGVTLIEQLRREAPRSAIVALSLRDSATLRGHALAAGARAFVAKHEPNEALLDAIRAAALLSL